MQPLTLQLVQNPAIHFCCQLTDLGLQLFVFLGYSFQTFLQERSRGSQKPAQARLQSLHLQTVAPHTQTHKLCFSSRQETVPLMCRAQGVITALQNSPGWKGLAKSLTYYLPSFHLSLFTVTFVCCSSFRCISTVTFPWTSSCCRRSMSCV